LPILPKHFKIHHPFFPLFPFGASLELMFSAVNSSTSALSFRVFPYICPQLSWPVNFKVQASSGVLLLPRVNCWNPVAGTLFFKAYIYLRKLTLVCSHALNFQLVILYTHKPVSNSLLVKRAIDKAARFLKESQSK